MNKKVYKVKRYLNCPYCNKKYERVELVNHIDKIHPDMIPEGYTSARIVFNKLHKKEHGDCVVCGRPTKWNEKYWKYERICGRQVCKETLRKRYEENMKKVGKTTKLSEDPERIKAMLAGRSISGTYTFTDGGKKEYTGSYERKCLEFFDKVLGCKSDEIMSPGPIIDYAYKGESHIWITDFYFLPANLVIEVKDGGDNPNNREMISYREKQIDKEKAITALNKYNYLRLTNNNFTQLFNTLAEIKEKMLDGDDGVIININEEVGGLPPQHPMTDRVYIIPYSFENVFSGDIEGLGFTNSLISENMLIVNKEGSIEVKNIREFLKNRMVGFYEYTCNDWKVKYESVLRKWKNNEKVNENYFYDIFADKESISEDEVCYDKRFQLVCEDLNHEINLIYTNSLLEEGLNILNKSTSINCIDPSAKALVYGYKNCTIKEDLDGYFVYNSKTKLRSKSYSSLNEISSTIIELVNNIDKTMIGGV